MCLRGIENPADPRFLNPGLSVGNLLHIIEGVRRISSVPASFDVKALASAGDAADMEYLGFPFCGLVGLSSLLFIPYYRTLPCLFHSSCW